jgi:hypothetical protein
MNENVNKMMEKFEEKTKLLEDENKKLSIINEEKD